LQENQFFRPCAYTQLIGLILLLCALLISSRIGFAQPEALSAETIERLIGIQYSADDKRSQLNALQAQLNALPKDVMDADKEELIQQIAQLEDDVKELRESFSQIALGGVDLSVFEEPAAEDQFDWRKEFSLIMRPILDMLKDLTEKPRRIDRLKSEITTAEEQLEAIQKARAALDRFNNHSLPTAMQERVTALSTDWAQREKDTEQELAVARYQLTSLQGENTHWLQLLGNGLKDFFSGRGLTILLAVTAAAGVWLLMRGLFWLYTKKLTTPSERRRGTRYRVITYSFRALTVFAMVLAVLITLYAAGDLLLLVLMALILIGAGLSFKSILPRYLMETKLLLDLGPVREGERLVYSGIPWQVKTINVYSVLRNPELEGVLRLPLATLSDLNSRPCGNEPWFPCHTGDYVLLPDGSFAQVLRQTPELVVLSTLGGMQVHYPSVDFIQLGARNLSREGFGVAMTFGIDYSHQAISLDQVPQTLQQALTKALEQAGLTEQVLNVLVDFKEAAASSLDYLIFISLKSTAAAQYFAVQRLVQKTCVTVCNREGWGIPFTQITVHQGTGFERLQSPKSTTKTMSPALESS